MKGRYFFCMLAGALCRTALTSGSMVIVFTWAVFAVLALLGTALDIDWGMKMDKQGRVSNLRIVQSWFGAFLMTLWAGSGTIIFALGVRYDEIQLSVYGLVMLALLVVVYDVGAKGRMVFTVPPHERVLREQERLERDRADREIREQRLAHKRLKADVEAEVLKLELAKLAAETGDGWPNLDEVEVKKDVEQSLDPDDWHRHGAVPA